VRKALLNAGLHTQIRALQDNTATAAQAAEALECTVGEIAKSLMFRRVTDDSPVLAVLSGVNRVAPDKLAKTVGGTVTKADAAFVKQHSGFEIGGVPPLGHLTAFPVVFDEKLRRYAVVWAAAGSAYAVFPAAADELAKAAGAVVADIAED
jgi:prolyl-tRNA editing enzyme YbaK/EbsC (Cys-tRNA(Pro) deacylase)